MNIPKTVEELNAYESWLRENGATIHISAPAGSSGTTAASHARGQLIEDYMVAKFRSVPIGLPDVPDGSIVKEMLRSPSWETTLILRPEHAQAWWEQVGTDHSCILVWGEQTIEGTISYRIDAEALQREINAGTFTRND